MNWKGATRIRSENGVTVIGLGKSFESLIDDSDFEKVRCFAWQILNNHSSRNINRFILGAQKNQQIDHINGNGLDNRRQNLRFITQSQNNLNFHKLHKKTTNLPVGVYRESTGSKFYASIKINKRPKYLGLFDSPEQAGEAYQKARIKQISNSQD